MGIATKQLEAIFTEINENFKNNRFVTIKPGEGDPPEKYEVTYNIKGLHLNKKKEVVEASHHTIAITIPFGFPHFPPNCKPISSIFHPDFDQAAICIGDFWKKESTITDLIVHIGHMICGEVFSIENAFNEDAVTWYKQHRDNLPFESVDFSIDSELQPVSALWTNSFSELETLEIDTLEELEPEEDLIPPDIEQPTISAGPSAQPAADIDTDLLKLMVKQKRFYTLYSSIQAIPAEHLTPLIEELKDRADAELKKAKQIFEKGLDFEHQGWPDKALEQFNLLTGMIIDYPELEETLKRTQIAAEAYKDFRQPTEKARISGNKQAAGERAAKPQKDLTFFTEKPEIHTPVLPIIIASSAAVLVAIAVFFLYSTNSQYKKAQTAYTSCKTLLAANEFNAAEKQCNLALSTVSDIHFFKGRERSSLSHDIQETLSSPKLRQGLAGMILVDGRYIPKGEEKALAAFTKDIEEGDTSMAHLLWEEARNHYQQALDIATRVGSIAKNASDRLEKVKKNMNLIQANILFNEGRKLKESGDIDSAVTKLEKAKEATMTLDDAEKIPLIKSIEPLLDGSRFLKFKKDGDSAFAKDDWQKAAKQYQEALDLGKSLKNRPTAQLAELSENKTKASLYATIQEGKEAFDNAQWDEAIRRYESAINLLKENSAILKQGSSEESRKKLARIMLQASIVRDKQDVARKLKDKRYQQALSKLQAILETIRKSAFSHEEYFQQIIKEVELRVVETKDNQLISDGTEYLTKNYKDIVIKNYPVAKEGSLIDPQATFVKKLGSRLLFKLECTDNGQGSPLRLIMYYTYDPAAKRWEFYSNTQ
jgi:ubiquitin-protein ligase